MTDPVEDMSLEAEAERGRSLSHSRTVFPHTRPSSEFGPGAGAELGEPSIPHAAWHDDHDV